MVMKAKSNNYHLDCFACHRCQHRFCIGDKFFLVENRVLCENDCENRAAAPPQNINLRNSRPPSESNPNPQMLNTFANATPPAQMLANMPPFGPPSQSPKIQAPNVSQIHNNPLTPTSNSGNITQQQQPQQQQPPQQQQQQQQPQQLSAPSTPVMVQKQIQSPQHQVLNNSGGISSSSAQNISGSGSNNNIKVEPSDVQSESIPPCLM